MSDIKEQVMAALSTVIEPELHKDIVSLNMVRDLSVEGSTASFNIVLTTPACPLKDVFVRLCNDAVIGKVAGIENLTITWDSQVPVDRRIQGQLNAPMRSIIAVSSGKGCVGNSTVSVNLSVALAHECAKVGLIDADMVLETGTDVVGHINGGHSALPDDQIVCLCESCTKGLEIVHNGNERAALLTLNTARELNKLDQIILGTDGPAGSGVQPLGILRMVAMLASLGKIDAATAFCFANGNTSRQRELDTGLLEVGYAADFVLMDQAQHAPGRNILESIELGNLPGVGMTIIDGIVRSTRSRNTPPARTIRA